VICVGLLYGNPLHSMGKNSSSVSDWHRKQRKKELAKNKEARIKARDERVVAEKTSGEIHQEIRKLERLHKNAEQRPHNVQSKLDRLNKELKLVTEKEEQDKKQRLLTLEQQKQIQQHQPKNSYQPLENPAVSVYYHAVMNPFGAPPPGQPRIFHRRGGGTTMNLYEACTPEEQFLPPPPPPPPSRPPVQQQQQQPERYQQNDNRHPPPSPPPPPPRNDMTRYKQSATANTDSRKPKVEAAKSSSVVPTPPPPDQQKQRQTKKVIDPLQMPALPKPSAAVERSKKKKQAADIWASTEEIEYEDAVTGTGLEGVADRKNSDSNPLLQWFYRDTAAGRVQGPYSLEQMLQWVQAGFFPDTTPVSGSAEGPWKALGQAKPFRKVMMKSSAKKKDTTAQQHQHTSVVAKKGPSVQDRIAALRNETRQETHDEQEGEEDETAPSSVADRIAALRREQQQAKEQQQLDTTTTGTLDEEPGNGGNDNNRDEEKAQGVESVQSRIAALRAEQIQTEESDGGPESNRMGDTVQDRIAALRAQQDVDSGADHDSVPPPPPPPPPVNAREENVPTYPVDDDAIAPYPAVAQEAPAYPIDDADDDNDGAYNVSYPLDDAYPATGDYPMDEDVDDEYYSTAAVGEYPIDDGGGGGGGGGGDETAASLNAAAPPPKKKIKVDRAVVSLLPSHLQKRQARK